MKLLTKNYFSNYLLVITVSLFTSAAVSQSNTPCGAPVLSVNAGCVNTAGTTVGATYQSNAANGGTPTCASPGAPDVWYSFVAPASGSVTITTTAGTMTDSGMALYSGPCGSPTQIVCDDDGGAGFMSAITNGTLTPGTTYYIRIWRYSSGTGTFSICVQTVTPPSTPANDDCSGAYSVTVNPDNLCGSTTFGTVNGATASSQNTASCFGTENDDVWFSFVATSTSHTIDLLNVAGSTTDMYHSVWSGACPALTLVAGSCSDPDNSVVTGLTVGNTYFIRVNTWSSASGATSTFDLCIGTPGPAPTNVDCSQPDPICSGSPIVFTAQANGTQASTVNPGNDYDCLFTSPNPSWYYLEIATGGNLAIDIAAGSDIDFELWGPFPNYANAVANCDSYGVPLDCSYSTSATEQANATGVVAGEVYVLLVTNYANTVQTITLSDAASNTATTDCSIVTLSVELSEFSGQFNENMSEVELNWTTSSERNNSHFIIEKSLDTKQWSGVGMETGSGTTSQTTNYQMIDNNPYSGQSYYRLKQFDFDGTITISDIISVNRTNENDIQLYPSPTKNAITINSNNEIVNINIVDLQGSTVYKQNNVSQKMVRINLSNLREGMYYTQIQTDKGTTIERISVIK